MSSSRFRPRFALVALASAVLVCALAGTAIAKKQKVTATLNFAPPSSFSGKVNSKNASCRSGAKVSLRYYTSASDTTPETVGKDKANKKGNWAIEVPGAIAGEYQVRVAPRSVGEHDFQVNCASYVGLRYVF